MFSLFFIKRPIFATVLAILITLAGAISYFGLPVAQYPEMTPPVVRVSAYYYGASASVIADSVASVIEPEVNGVDRMLYMSSTSASDGSYSLDITFEVGVDADMAAVLVQNRVNRATAKLPEEVRRQGITVKKQSPNFVGIITLSPKDEAAAKRYDDLFLANYVVLNIKDELARIKGVGDVSMFPAKDYGMRIWFDPEKLASRQMTVNDVLAGLREQNVQVAAGKVGGNPAPAGTAFTYQVNTLGRLENEEQFENVILKTGEGGAITRLKDVARVELGARSYDTFGAFNGRSAAVMIVYQAPGGNAVAITQGLRDSVTRMSTNLPEGLEMKMVYDASVFINQAVNEVYHTLFEAVILVIIVVLVFLGSLRSTLIPILVIPVALVGTFMFMAGFGFSINMLTLFGLVLAIGIVVDDAIVVVENVERNMAEHHLAPKEATAKAMQEVFGAVIAISLVLSAVFVPTAALGGITGQMYKQFALTIAASTILSAVCALTFSPAMCGVLLKPHKKDHKPNIFNRGFNWVFDKLSSFYEIIVRFLVHKAVIAFSLLAFAGTLALIVWSTKQVPTGFLPNEDRGLVFVDVILPDNASLERSQAAFKQVNDIIKNTEGVDDVAGLGGFSLINGAGTNYAVCFAMLKDWDARLEKGRDLNTIVNEIRIKTAKVQDAMVLVFAPPAIDGLGSGTGFDMRLQDRTGLGRNAVAEIAYDIVGTANRDANVTAVNTAYRPAVPEVFAMIDREKVKKLDVPLQNVFDALAGSLGSAYANDFVKFGRTFQVNVQADAAYRASIDSFKKINVRSRGGAMVPLGAVMTMNDSFGPDRVFRYNMYPNAIINGEPAKGKSSGEALVAMQTIAEQKMPAGMNFEWTSLAYQESKQSGEGMMVFGLAIVVVYLILAAQYESWTTPLAVVLSVPLAVLGAMAGCMIRGLDNNVYTQIGLVLLVGLGAKNAILIVEFAKQNRESGMGIIDATAVAAKQRLRPILMTSFAFILGVLPLVIAEGAGAASRQALGTAVFFGMIGATLLGLIFTPVLHVAIQGVTELLFGAPKVEKAADTQAEAVHA